MNAPLNHRPMRMLPRAGVSKRVIDRSISRLRDPARAANALHDPAGDRLWTPASINAFSDNAGQPGRPASTSAMAKPMP
jgi:hypothetical protein